MPVRNPDELTDRLDRDLAWRRRELLNLSSMMRPGAPYVHEVAIRAAVCMLYAHWEGFMRRAARSYLEFVANRRLKYRELRRNFLALGLRREIGQAAGQRRTRAHAELVETVFQRLEDQVAPDIEKSIDTGRNLGGDALDDLLEAVGFDATAYRAKRALLDERLLRTRNQIAHGEYLLIDAEAYAELQRGVVEMMDRFRNDVKNAAMGGGYRADVPAPSRV